ncbi:MAG TPA: hypothetical protein VH988_19080 [Thermoanaerobaculia bacterium]|jgi:hypothetical protein|nr:hypothetical protein [Thermoanaerobaculia bacterium]
MAEEISHVAFTHKEVAEVLVRHHGIHDGIWGLYIEFGIGAVNIGAGPDDVTPAAVVPVLKIGLQRFQDLNAISVDAAKVNPPHPEAPGGVVERPRSKKRT